MVSRDGQPAGEQPVDLICDPAWRAVVIVVPVNDDIPAPLLTSEIPFFSDLYMPVQMDEPDRFVSGD